MNGNVVSENKEKLAGMIDVAPWEWIAPHTERGTVVLVDADLDLADVAFSVASDDKPKIERLLMNNMLRKPTAEDLASWESNRQNIFSMIIISPFILVQKSS